MSATEIRLEIPVRVVSRASRSGIVGVERGRLRIRTSSPPVDGRANEDVIRQLAAAFSVPRSRVSLKRGAKSALKTVVVERPEISPAWLDDLHFS